MRRRSRLLIHRARTRAAIAAAMLNSCLAHTATADIIHVPQDQPTIQAGIDAAGDGDHVVIADGFYTGSGNRGIDFRGKRITVRSQSGPEQCIIDCEYQARGFYFHSGETREAVLEGLTIRRGLSDLDSPRPNSIGGGILCYRASPTIRNCRIVESVCLFRGGKCGIGPSAGVPQPAAPTRNHGSGGGIACWESQALLIGCFIAQNCSEDLGGGVAISGEGIVTMINCVVADNEALYIAGISIWNDPAVITNCTVTENHSMRSTGGIRATPSTTISNCIVWRNNPSDIEGDPIVRHTLVGRDPFFVDPDGGNYRVLESPAVDAAGNDAVPAEVTKDLDGNPRFYRRPRDRGYR